MEDISEDIVANSDQLNAEDLIAGPIVVTVKGFKRLKGDQQPWTVVIDGGHQPWKPCKTMRRLIVKLWGNDPGKWFGRRVRLYNESSVRWAGNPVGGIRVSGMSDIGDSRTVVLTETRGKKREWPIELLKGGTPVNKHGEKFRGAPEEVLSICKMIKAAYENKTSEPLQDAEAAMRAMAQDTAGEWGERLTAFFEAVEGELA